MNTPVIATLLLALGLIPANPQGGGSLYEKRRVLSESLLGKRPATDAEVRQLLVETLSDPDPGVRLEAVGALATILTMSRLPTIPAGLEWTVRLRSVAEDLRPELEKALDDSDLRVRREALRGVVGDVLYTKPGSPLPTLMLRMLAAHYDKHPQTTDREFIVTALQTSYRSEDQEARSISLTLLKRALEDQDPYVVQAGAHSATKAAAPEVLPLLVAQLKNPSYVARMGVAQGIASYGAAAKPYLPQLEAALAAETHDITRKTIAGTITVITR